jgi:hypothetical protein
MLSSEGGRGQRSRNERWLRQKELPVILENTGRRVDEFFHNMVDLTAREEGVQESRNWNGDLIDSRPIEDNYLIRVHNSGFRSEIEESRLDPKRNPVEQAHGEVRGQGVFAPGYRVSSGFASSTFLFATSFQSESRFPHLGEERIDNQDTYVVVFAQRLGEATITVPWSGQGDNVEMMVQGIAWVDKNNFQIIRLRTDLLTPRPEIGLDRQTTEVTFNEVRIRDITTSLWLPSVVKVYVAFYQQNFRNEHHYSDYRRYRVSSKMVAPK